MIKCLKCKNTSFIRRGNFLSKLLIQCDKYACQLMYLVDVRKSEKSDKLQTLVPVELHFNIESYNDNDLKCMIECASTSCKTKIFYTNPVEVSTDTTKCKQCY